MTSRTSLGVVTAMAVSGWFLASVLGVLACMFAPDVSGHRIPWIVLGAFALGSMLATIPIALALLTAYGGFHQLLDGESLDQFETVSWRWAGVALLFALEALVLPLTLITASADDDTLIVSLPFNLMIVTAAVLLACWPYQQRASIAICIIHMLGLVLATLAAAVEIETVIVSGLLLLVSGLVLCLVGTRPLAFRIAFGLSTVIFIVTSFLIIAIGGVSENEAEAPLFAAIVAYQVLFVPIGLFMLYREFSYRRLPVSTQFGLKQILALMAIVCVASALTKLAHSVDEEVRVGVSLIIGLLVLVGIVMAIATGFWARWADSQSPMNSASALGQSH